MSQNEATLTLDHNESKEVKDKAKTGLYLLLFRSASLYLLRASSIYFMAKWLNPDDYGMFAIISNWTWAISYFLPDLCVEAALIQVQGKLSDNQMRNFFGLSFWRGLVIVFFFIVCSQFITSYQKIPHDTSFMFVVAAIAGLFTSFRLPPRTILERNLKFKEVVNIEIAETFIMYVAQLVLAYLGFGAWSFVWAIFIRALAGMLFTYYYEPIFYKPILIKEEISSLMTFGLPTQVRKVIIGLKCLLVPILLGKWLNTYDLGLLTWTISLASIPAVLSDNYDRVLFPSLSRLQNNPKEFGETARRGLELSYLLFGIIFGGLAFVSAPVITLLFDPKWAAAIPLLPLTCFWIFLARSRHLTGSILNGEGRPKELMNVEILSVILEILMTIIILPNYGVRYYIFGMIGLEVILNFISLWLCRKHLTFTTLIRPIVVSLSMLSSGYITLKTLELSQMNDFSKIICGSILFSIFYVFIGSLIDRKVFKDFKQISNQIFGNFQGKFRNIIARRSRS